MASAAKKTSANKRGPAIPVKTNRPNEFPVFTMKNVPTAIGRERTNWGWEELVKPKMAKRIPAEAVERARPSFYAFFSKHKDDTEGPFAAVNGQPCRGTTLPATDEEGKVIPLMVDGKVKKDGRNNVIPAFYDFVRVR